MPRKLLAVDTETYEEDIKKWGAGYHLGKGHIIGISFADETGWSIYLPLAHPETTPAERNKNIAIARDLFAEPCLHLGHNSLYDNVYLTNELGFPIHKQWHDTQYTMSLLDEYRGRFGGPGYSLDAVAQDLIGQKKAKTGIDEYCEKMSWKGDSRQHLWKMPASLVDKYARQDVLLLPKLYKVQMEHIAREELEGVYDIESCLIPILVGMNNAGLQVDEKRRLNLLDRLNVEAARLEKELEKEFGKCNYNSNQQLAKLFDQYEIEYEKTPKGNPSIKNEHLEMLAKAGNPFAHKLVQWRKVTKVRDTFVAGAFKDFQDKNGVIHSTILPVAADDGGTVSGRFACKNPNLQQVPSKDGDEEQGDLPLGTMCRDIFVTDEGRWMASTDYSQLELRMIINYAMPPDRGYMTKRFNALLYTGFSEDKAMRIVQEEQRISKEVLDQMIATFRENPDTDVHNLIAGITELPRKEAKTVTFGVAFYEGKQKLMKKNGWDEEKADYVLSTYFDKLPFVKPSRDIVVRVAETRGYIRTISGRKARLAPYMIDPNIKPRDRCTYRMYNRLPQGSGADAMKKAVVDAWKAGVLEVYTLTMIIHDEGLGHIPKTKEGLEAFREFHNCMENSYKLNIPLLSEPELGSTWGNTEGRRKLPDGSKETVESFFARYEAML